MAQKIVRLTDSVINQIAAGEVVENPASIVKELLENSLDAGSRHIAIAIRGGGLQSIEIEDDGSGMSPEDAVASLERHATSKIRSADDLNSLTTMGFRGEALAAISSISHFELKTSNGENGTFIRTKGSDIQETIPCARNQGTTISVRSLFFNVPARKKFQKSVASNVAQVTKIIEIISCAYPEVSFSYTSHDECILQLPSQRRRERIEAVFGPFPHLGERPALWGLFKAPQDAKSHRRGQVLFINRRPVFSPLISKAVQMGYGTRLKENMYPSFVLFLEVDPAVVDVNVHPQKKEVRLSEESSLFQRVEGFVAECFTSNQEESAPTFSGPLSFEPPAPFLFAEEGNAYYPKMRQGSLPIEVVEKPLTVMGRYLLLEKEGLLLIDLIGAHARVMAEELKKETITTQALLWPLELDMDDPELFQDLQKMGVECRWIGVKKIAVDALPSMIDSSEFLLFISSWKEGKTLDAASVRFCRNLKKRYSLDEAILIWRRLQNCRDRLYDPIGKKIWEKIEQKDLDIWMSRG